MSRPICPCGKEVEDMYHDVLDTGSGQELYECQKCSHEASGWPQPSCHCTYYKRKMAVIYG